MAYKYQGNGKWEQVYNPSKDKNSSSSSRPSTVSKGEVESYTPPPINSSTNKATTTSSDSAEKEYKEIETNILRGNASVVPNPKYKAKQTVLMQYLGKNLTGLYFVESVVHTFDSGGYSQTLDLSRTGFGDSIKKGGTTKPVGQVAPTEGSLIDSSATRPSSATPKPATPTTTTKPNNSNSETPVNKWGTVTPKIGLNIRNDPSTKNPRLTAMPYGSRVFCVSKKNGWYRVEWKTKSKTYKGWSEGSYIKLDK